MKSNLSGFILSTLIHSALFGFVAFVISDEPVKKTLPEPRVLSLAMFEEVVEPPAVPVETVQKKEEIKEESKVIAKKMPAQESLKPIVKKKKVTPKKRKLKKKVKAKKPPKPPVKKRPRDKELEQLLAATAKPVKRPAPRALAKPPVARAPKRQPASPRVTPRRQQHVVNRRPIAAPKRAAIRPVRRSVSPPKQVHSSGKIEAAYKARLQQLIAAHKKYPRRAKRSGDEGVVKISFVILPNGTISQIQLVQSSGSRTLDAAAKKVLTQVSGKLPFPQGINKSQWHLTLPIRYRLN